MTNKVLLKKETQEILKNFATINSSILFRKGSTIKTISVGENAVAEYLNEGLMKVEADEFFRTDKYTITYEEITTEL